MRSFICSLAVTLFVSPAFAGGETNDPIAKGIQDNSFLIEEAYNQEYGVIQHIYNAQFSLDRVNGTDSRAWLMSFTQEWPVPGQRNQLSYTIPYNILSGGGAPSEQGFGDVLLNYRFQALFEDEVVPAFAPRFSLVLPTGDVNKGLGNDRVGYQFNLPMSKIVSDRVTLHVNAGTTLFPDVQSHDLTFVNLGGSAIYAVTRDFNLMLETVGLWSQTVNGIGGVDREFQAVLSPGFRFSFLNRRARQVVVGLAAPIGLNKASPDYGVFIYLSVEHRLWGKDE